MPRNYDAEVMAFTRFAADPDNPMSDPRALKSYAEMGGKPRVNQPRQRNDLTRLIHELMTLDFSRKQAELIAQGWLGQRRYLVTEVDNGVVIQRNSDEAK